MDRFGVFASAACAVHCLLGPVIAGSASAAHLFRDERFELVLVLIACVLAFFALQRGWLRHRSRAPILFGAAGTAVFLAVRTLELEHHDAEWMGSIAASALLITGHVLNLRALKQCELDCCADEDRQTIAQA